MKRVKEESFELRLDHYDGHLRGQQLADSGKQVIIQVESVEKLPMQFLWDAKSVRVLGAARNASLICWLIDYKNQWDGNNKLLIGSPAIVKDDQLKSPERLWLKFDSLTNLPASVGGWHAADHNDYATYDLIQHVAAGYVGKLKRPCQITLSRHPAWPALSFIGGVDRRSAANLLALIVDPRWYVDPLHPCRAARLRAFLGLAPKSFQTLLDPKTPTVTLLSRYEMRAKCVWDTWSLTKPTKTGPGNFLWACAVSGSDTVKGTLKASTMLISYLTQNWLQAITPGFDLFVPEYFFNSPETAAAYKKHMQRCGRQH